MTWNELEKATATCQFPCDIMIQILSRLPIKSTLRFKSVNKAWYFLFSSPKFIQHYARATSPASTTLSLLLHTHDSERDVHEFSWLLDPSPHGEPTLKSLVPPFRAAETEVLGSINGLICLRDATSFVLWNPAIRKQARIPSPQLIPTPNEGVFLGFAYDEKTDCYKVVRVLYPTMKMFHQIDKSVTVEIYSTQTRTWTQILHVSFPWYLKVETCGTVVRCSPHWYVQAFSTEQRGTRQVMVWFDASEGVLKHSPFVFEQPHFMRKVGLGVEGGERAVVFDHKVLMGPEFLLPVRVDLYSVVDSWRLQRRSSSEDGGREVLHVEMSTIKTNTLFNSVLGFWRNGELIALDAEMKLVVYDPKSEEIRHLPMSIGPMDSAGVYEYYQTLVAPPCTS